jgi:phosphoglycerate dehydrogenase-like enzyme
VRVLVNLGETSGAFLARIGSVLPGVEVLPVSPAHHDLEMSDDDVVLTMSDDTPVLRRLLSERVRWVHVLGTGIDGFPLGAVPEQTTLTCSRGASGVAIAEFVLAAMLSYEKDLPRTWISEPPERWSRARLGTLSGETCVLVGLGAIGCEVARRAVAFDMKVLGVRNRPVPSPIEGVEVLASLEQALPLADHLVLAAPATEATRKIIGSSALELVKPGVHLVNVARGGLVDQEELLAALDDGRVSRATLDVVEPEPLPAGHPFYSHPRVRLSPHVSWSAPVTLGLILQMFLDNVERYRTGRELLGVVDPRLGY